MSYVTGLTLIVATTDERHAAYLSAWLRNQGRGWSLSRDLADMHGGHKHPQCALYCAGLNGFTEDAAFLAEFQAIGWSQPDKVVLVLQTEDDAAEVHRPGRPDPDRAEREQLDRLAADDGAP